MRRAQAARIVLLGLGIAMGVAFTGCGGPSGDGKPVRSSPEQIARGKYLALAADCAACHTAPGGPAMAGGVVLASPFGSLYGSNITPDPAHGIGHWSADDFYKALHDGTSPDGHQLYPAMPYASYRAMPREDVDAVYAYLMQLQPVSQENQAAHLHFPYNMRFGISLWKLLFLKDELPVASIGQSSEWQRGRYLANVLGHCGECHTPRGLFGQMSRSDQFKGATLGRWIAPDITPIGLAARGWTESDISTFMKTGIAPQGSAYGDMHKVVNLSTQHLTDADLHSLSRFMMGDATAVPQLAKEDASSDQRLAAGRQTYLNNCAGCHGRDGDGRPHVAVPMRGNSTLRLADPNNLIVSVLDGLPAQEFPGLERMQDMPSFGNLLSDTEMADLSNYLRSRFGGQRADVRADAVKKFRS